MMQIVIPCLKLKTADCTCSPLAKERLALLVSDIQDIIALSENAGFTVPLLLTQFGLCLPNCIEEKFHDIIYTISKVLQQLAIFFFNVAADQLAKELKVNLASSNILILVSAFALYDFKKPPSVYHHLTIAKPMEYVKVSALCLSRFVCCWC